MSSTVGSCDCGRRWRGGAEAHCVTCHRQFSSDRAFDKHLTNDGCKDPAELYRDDGRPWLVPVQRKDGIVWMIAKYAHMPSKVRQRVKARTKAQPLARQSAGRSVAVVTRPQRANSISNWAES